MPTKTDAIYARYSSHAQDDSTSIEVQIEQCERSAGGKCSHYIDRAKTGRTMTGRMELLRLLADAEAGKVRRVFVYKFDRLGRDAETHLIARQLEDAGAELVSATEGTNQLARGIQLVVAEDYSRQLANRTRDGLIKRAEQRGFTGGVAPYGYRVIDRDGRRVLAVDPVEAEIVRDVVHRYLCESVGFKALAKQMRAKGIQSRRQNDKGKRRSLGWTFTTVRALLLNPILTGRMRFNARKMQLNRSTGKRVPRFKNESELVIWQDENLRIIDDRTFDAIQARLKTRIAGHASAPNGHVAKFTGLVFCQCGAKCHSVKSQNAKGSYRYYLCSKKMRYDECEHGGRRMREDAILMIIQNRFAALFNHKDAILSRALEVATDAARENRDNADRIKTELAEVEGKQSNLIRGMASFPDSAKAAVGRELAELEERRNLLLAAIDGLREQATVDTEGLVETVRAVFDEARESLAAATTPAAFNGFVERFIGPVEIQADGTLAQKKTPALCEGQIAGAS